MRVAFSTSLGINWRIDVARPTHQRMAMLTRIREEARLDRQAEDARREWREDQRDAHEDRIARRRGERWG